MKASLWIAAVLGFVGFVTSFGAHIVAVNLPTYAKEVGIGLAMIGVLIAAYDFAEIIAKPLFGALADHVGMKRTMLAGIALFIVASLSYPLVDPRLLVAVRFAQGMGAAALSAVSAALVGVYFAGDRGRAFGIYNAIKGAGYVVSPIIGGAIVERTNFTAIFYACAAVGAVAFLVSMVLPKPQSDASAKLEDDNDFSLKSLEQVMRQPDLLKWYLASSTCSLSESCSDSCPSIFLGWATRHSRAASSFRPSGSPTCWCSPSPVGWGTKGKPR
jgi:MFS family permease